MPRTALTVLLLASFLLVTIGCGGSKGPSTAKVTGTVTYKGNPVPQARVIFTPKQGPVATGTTDAGGRYTLTTTTSGDGAVPGTHKVAIRPEQSDAPPMPGTPEAAKAPPSAPRFPERYSDPEKSGFTAEVKANTTNELPAFDMKD